MKEFDRVYDFYDLSEKERIALIGQKFREKSRKEIYFVFGLAAGEFNYGIQQGLIRVSNILTYKDKIWFMVSAFSPDDLDMDLDFGVTHTHLRQEVIAFLEKMPKRDASYRGVLEAIQKHFGAGEMTS